VNLSATLAVFFGRDRFQGGGQVVQPVLVRGPALAVRLASLALVMVPYLAQSNGLEESAEAAESLPPEVVDPPVDGGQDLLGQVVQVLAPRPELQAIAMNLLLVDALGHVPGILIFPLQPLQ